MASFSSAQAERFVARLRKLNPPKGVLDDFIEKLEIAQALGTEDKLEELLKEVARKENWTVPWEVNGEKLSFRARLIDPTHPEHFRDSPGEQPPSVEQAYRRGFSQGFSLARRLLGFTYGDGLILSEEEQKIDKWRRCQIHKRKSFGYWDLEEPPCSIRETKRRSGLNLKLRYAIMERDRHRCKLCGQAAEDGATLEVDHIVPVSRGGSDDPSNLQTLCFDCNQGKSDKTS